MWFIKYCCKQLNISLLSIHDSANSRLAMTYPLSRVQTPATYLAAISGEFIIRYPIVEGKHPPTASERINPPIAIFCTISSISTITPLPT